ncbi:CHAT domain-containing protein [Leptolyngbya cf. ectocarpi LEGE 11479]|uniref:CHAT domain-containing protein n=1 Tax=Leptolyngbya cf. ectocarpi LEGE 11479 TaxID=1828722 RepID=A0A929F6R6_LEPEC|nr:CHAT domain-containing protein [Leptolyngbya ectocarpi]MBE9068330.1 CHAT domain-containing protein [Leptolyngbya cf. ectocarpi LEGE 11479]
MRRLRYGFICILACCLSYWLSVGTVQAADLPLFRATVYTHLEKGLKILHYPPQSPLGKGGSSSSPPYQGGVRGGAAATTAILLDQGQQFYDAGQLQQAITQWRQAAATAATATNKTLAYTYLTLVYQDLGQWSAAENAMAEARRHVPNQPVAMAQVLNAQGRLQFYQGHPAAALATWQTAEQHYRQGADSSGVVLAQTNQIQAWRSLGYYTQARQLMTTLRQELAAQPASLLKAQGLQSVGILLRTTGALEESEVVLNDSLAIAQALDARDAIAQAQFQLGNTAQAQGDSPTAIDFYQQVLSTTPSQSRLWFEAALNQLRLAPSVATAATLYAQLTALLPSRWGIYAQVNFTETLLAKSEFFSASFHSSASLLAKAAQQARTLNDPQAESYALGQLGKLYEQSQQFSEALSLTDQALDRARQVQADEIMAIWQWQRGRILKAQGQTQTAIVAYSQAVTLLESLDQDLVALNPDIQFSFQQQVEPVYRQLVQLLLQTVDTLPTDEQQQRLAQSRDVIEALQLAELENFFREACLTYRARPIDQIDSQAAVVYPILLDQRLEVILALPDGSLRHYGTALSVERRRETFQALRQALNPAFPAERVLAPAQQLYDWLLRPAEESLAQQDIQRLVFVLDGSLRNVPMAVLHDGNQFLVERYGIALTPGLQLFESPSLSDQRFEVLAGGMSLARQGFNALPAVDVEIDQIQAQASARVLLNQNFTKAKLAKEVVERPISIVHLATHGQFSSKADETFILTWNTRLQIKELEGLLQQRELQTPVELLILSACQTAKGDDRAALGMAGVAVRSGARSTIASLWSVEDFSTADLMSELYRQLSQPLRSRSDALQQAQLSLLKSANYSHPYYWAPFVLTGNWL